MNSLCLAHDDAKLVNLDDDAKRISQTGTIELLIYCIKLGKRSKMDLEEVELATDLEVHEASLKGQAKSHGVR